MQRKDLEGKPREELVKQAEELGIARARALTIPELIDEIALAHERKTGEKKVRGWFGRARDLLTSVIDRGLGLPDAPMRRTGPRVGQAAPPPLPTVTLAEIYAAQGHLERAIATLDEVLVKEPGHTEAAKLRNRFQMQVKKTMPSTPPPGPVVVATAPLDATPSPAASSATDSPMRTAEAALEDTPALAAEEQTFEVDEIVAVAVDQSTVYVYWEVRPKTFAAAKNRHPEGALVVRVVAVAADSSGPASETRDVRVDALYGELFVRGLPQNAQVRLSVGYASDTGYEPFALGLDLTTPRALPAPRPARAFRRWSEIRREAEDPTLPRPAPSAGGSRSAAFGAPPPEVSSALPAPAWVDAGARLVQVSEAVPGGVVRTSFHRLPGSSEIFRKEAFFSKGPFRAADSFAFRTNSQSA